MNDLSTHRRLIVPGALIAALATLVLYLPSLSNGFVNWDDNIYVYANAGIRHFDLAWLLTAKVSSNWHPLTMLSIMIDYAIWGLNPFGYHLVNVVLHAVNTALVFILSAKVFERAGLVGRRVVTASVIAALLFGIHPLHVESVSWVSERKDVLSGLFFLLALLSYLRYAPADEAKRKGWYALSLVFFALGLLSKPMVVTLPAVLLILDFYPFDRLGGPGAVKRAVLEKIPFFALSVLFAVVAVLSQSLQAMSTVSAVPLSARIVTAVRAIAFYVYRMIVPIGLAPFYKLDKAIWFTDTWFIVSALFIIAASVFCVAAAKRSRAYAAAWLYYLVTLSPVLGIVQVGLQAAADRYTYLPSISLFMLAGAGVGLLYGRLDAGAGRVALRVFVIAALAVLSLLTIRQEAVWKDGATLWGQEIKVFPTERRGYYSRAQAYKDRGQYREAITDLTRAIEISPGYAEAYSLRGNSYKRLGELDHALEDMKTAVTLKPDEANFHYNLSLIYAQLGLREKAIESARTASRLGLGVATEYLDYLESQGR